METSTGGSQTASRTYYVYGSTRASSGTLQTDRTFTGQKQDGTGLIYYNARYYDSSLGTFLSPDTLVPDARRVVDYNRFLYVRGNPLSLNDPTGHCATTTNGEPDMNGDGECWQMANAIAGLGYTEQGFWDDWGGKNRSDWWLKNIANQSFATLEYLTPFYERYQGEFEGRTGLRQSVSLEPVPPHPVSGVADTIVPILLSDCETKDCVALTIDSIGVAGSSLTLASPVCGPFILECAGIGTAVGRGATIVGLGWTVVQGARDNASNADGLVAGFTAGVALTTKDPRIGLLAGVSQFLWDTFISPFDAWR